MAALTFRELSPQTWPDFERLFRGPGASRLTLLQAAETLIDTVFMRTGR